MSNLIYTIRLLRGKTTYTSELDTAVTATRGGGRLLLVLEVEVTTWKKQQKRTRLDWSIASGNMKSVVDQHFVKKQN
jgi:hypothetical protein